MDTQHTALQATNVSIFSRQVKKLDFLLLPPSKVVVASWTSLGVIVSNVFATSISLVVVFAVQSYLACWETIYTSPFKLACVLLALAMALILIRSRGIEIINVFILCILIY